MKVLGLLVLMLFSVVFANAQKGFLRGAVYDANGAVIVKARVSAVNEKGEKFVTVTNDEGIYSLNLPFNSYDSKSSSTDFRISRYEIIVEVEHFEKNILKDFRFVPSYKGEMNLDFALDVAASHNCGAGGCIEVTEKIEAPKADISNEIRQKQLEKLPTKQNKLKRKNN